MKIRQRNQFKMKGCIYSQMSVGLAVGFPARHVLSSAFGAGVPVSDHSDLLYALYWHLNFYHVRNLT